MVDIVIPIYKKQPCEDDYIALNQVFDILRDYNITFIHPKSLDIEAYLSFPNAQFKSFDDAFFENIQGYNRLMMDVDFYKSFHKKYILIYQTDAFVFKDELQFWCEKNYDYIGAPWLRSREKIPFIKFLWDNTLCTIKEYINYKNNGKTQKNKALLYNEVGNGGLSLRKREKFIEILEKLSVQKEIYLQPHNHSTFYAEDVFFSIEPQRNGIDFHKPNHKEACLFSIENKVEKAFSLLKDKLPFGCHRWNKENKNFWKKYIK